jgi:hypothetical protein
MVIPKTVIRILRAAVVVMIVVGSALSIRRWYDEQVALTRTQKLGELGLSRQPPNLSRPGY